MDFTINTLLKISLSLGGADYSAVVGAALEVWLLEGYACRSIRKLTEVQSDPPEGMAFALRVAPLAAIRQPIGHQRSSFKERILK